MTTFVVEPRVRMTWSTDDLASGSQLIEQVGQLDVVDKGHLINVIRPGVRLAEPRQRQRSPEVVVVQTSPGSAVYDSSGRSLSGRSLTRGVDRPLQQMMVGQADVEDIDLSWTAAVGTCDHSVQRSTQLVGVWKFWFLCNLAIFSELLTVELGCQF